MTLRRQQVDWEELAATDPLWAILSDPTKEGGRWDLDEFLATGAAEVDGVLTKAASLGYPSERRAALDFGCGVGRLTRQLATHFDQTDGVDVAAPMIDRARSANADRPNCAFHVNTASDLALFESDSFDLVYSSLVLQHMLSESLIRGYIAEFVRVAAPSGLVVFQLPTTIPLRYRLQPRRRLYRVLRPVGVSAKTLQDRLHLHPIGMRAMPAHDVAAVVAAAGGRLLATDLSTIEGFGIESALYWVTKP